MLLAYHLARVVVGGKDATDQLGELDFLRPGDLDDTIDRLGHGDFVRVIGRHLLVNGDVGRGWQGSVSANCDVA